MDEYDEVISVLVDSHNVFLTPGVNLQVWNDGLPFCVLENDIFTMNEQLPKEFRPQPNPNV